MKVAYLMSTLLLLESPATQPTSLRDVLSQASIVSPPEQTRTTLEQLQRAGVRGSLDLLPYIEEGGKPRTVALRLLPHFRPMDPQVRTRIVNLLPALRGAAELYAMLSILSDGLAAESAAPIIAGLKINGVQAVIAWAADHANPELAHLGLRRAKTLVQTEFTNWGLVVILGYVTPPKYLSRSEFSREVLDLILAACEHPENMVEEAIATTHRLVWSRALEVDSEAVKHTLEQIIRV